VPNAPATSRHPTSGSPDAPRDTTTPTVRDEIVPGAWESDDGRTVLISQGQRS
jgi:hypothetical protein